MKLESDLKIYTLHVNVLHIASIYYVFYFRNFIDAVTKRNFHGDTGEISYQSENLHRSYKIFTADLYLVKKFVYKTNDSPKRLISVEDDYARYHGFVSSSISSASMHFQISISNFKFVQRSRDTYGTRDRGATLNFQSVT